MAQNLGSMGLHCKQLSTEEMIEEFYLVYNPELAGKERLSNIKDVSSSMVSIKKDHPLEEDDDDGSVEQTIDNKAQVQAQQKIRQSERSREKMKDAERQVSRPDEKLPKGDEETGGKPKIEEETETFVPEEKIDAGEEAEQPLQAPVNNTTSDPKLNKNFDW